MLQDTHFTNYSNNWTIIRLKHGMLVLVVSVLGTLINYDDDDDDDDDNNDNAKTKTKKNNWVYEKNNSSA